MAHASMGGVPPIPLGTRPPSLLNPELQPGGGEGGGWQQGWEQSPAVAPLGRGDGKRQVGVTALCLCLQRKRSRGRGSPGAWEWGELAGSRAGSDPAAKGAVQRQRWLLQSSQQKALRLGAAEGMGSPGPPRSCPEGLVGPGPVAELVSLGRQGMALGWWAAWLTTCKLPAPPASPA